MKIESPGASSSSQEPKEWPLGIKKRKGLFLLGCRSSWNFGTVRELNTAAHIAIQS